MNQDIWTRVLDADALVKTKPRTIKTQGKQIVLFRLDADEVHAIDNRCPHEGYPLSTGHLEDGILTCEWHNWKFQLCDGECILGGENVRHYPLRIEDGGIWLDMRDPSSDEGRPLLYQSLENAFDDNSWGWAGRTVERLLASGEPAAEILGTACGWAARHAPYGFDHGLAATADLSRLIVRSTADARDDADANIGVPMLEAMNLMVEPNLRRPYRELGAPESVTAPDDGDWSAVEAEFRQRVEAENLQGAEGLIRGALLAGASADDVFPWLVHAATDHFLGFGHGQIYCVKAEELLQRIGWHHAHPVLTSLVSSIVYDTREDKLPYMKEFRARMADHLPRLGAWAHRARLRADGDTEASLEASLDITGFIGAVVDGTLTEALTAVAEALDGGVAADRIALLLGVAAAHRMFRFDASLEHNDDISEGWLHVTHLLTHADAVRETLRRRPSADALRGLFHSARFVQHLHVCDLPSEQRPSIPDAVSASSAEEPDLGLWRAVHENDPSAAMAAIRSGLRPERMGEVALAQTPIAATLDRLLIADRATYPIFVAHHIKTPMAALRLTDGLLTDPALSMHEYRDLPLLATARFLAHRLQERRIARLAKVSRVFVDEGRMQKKLTGY